MNCINCGKELSDGSAFCEQCGAAQQPEAQPQYQQPQYQQPQYQQPQYQQPQYQQPQYQYNPAYQQGGQYYADPNAMAPQKSTDPISVVGFICSLATWLFSTLSIANSVFSTFTLIALIMGLVFSPIGISRTKTRYKGRGLAIAGLVVSLVYLVLVIVVIIAAVALASSFINAIPF